MFSEFEHTCLLKMALECRRDGLSQSESRAVIKSRTGDFSAAFMIRQVVHTAFHPERCPDLV
ncbi:hypothetical protein [Pseudophaeobacter flagellatus]|uniref:hypothetical protein n=1 Tax=Pseudophaeobacter flagellatus TaxID=2899119 RepID=UPI001E2E1FAB|nr:hypothetical protein [Pseudophaeobacter flagellatus]MCD9146901.1 hypothetical protein [Pseudophaeobacter flagellatus]